MTTTLLKADTKANAITTAEFSTHTWLWRSDVQGSARCTLCGTWISTSRIFVGGRSATWSEVLVGAVLQHLEDNHHGGTE